IPPFTRLREGGVVIYDSSPRLDYPNASHEIKIEKYQEMLAEKKARAFGMPMGHLAKDDLKFYNARGTIAMGIIAHLIGISEDAIVERFAKRYSTEVTELNAKALRMGMDHAREQGWEMPELQATFTPVENDTRQIILGNEAIAAGAIVAGCR